MKAERKERKMKQLKNLKFQITAIFILFGINFGFAQEKPEELQKQSNEFIAEAQEALSDNDFASAEASYRKAIAKDPNNLNAKYNMGNLYYAKEKSLNAEQRLKEAAEIAATKAEKHQIFHNLGNSYMQQKNYSEAVNAFKNALRNDPNDDETRYNLALAKKKLEKENQDQDQNQDQEKQDDQDKKDQQEQKDENSDGEGGDDQKEDQKPKDEGENEKDKKDGDQNEDKEKEEGDEKKEDQGKGDEQKQPKPKPTQGQLSPQQIQNLLEAMNNEEKKVQDKINAQKAKGVKVKSEKDW